MKKKWTRRAWGYEMVFNERHHLSAQLYREGGFYSWSLFVDNVQIATSTQSVQLKYAKARAYGFLIALTLLSRSNQLSKPVKL